MTQIDIPASLYIAIGAIIAALIAGFFSFLNLVSSKENKVSEFRQAWIDGIRSEIACYAAAVIALGRFRAARDKFKEDSWYEATESAYKDAIESLTKIQLRLNPKHAQENPDSHEAKLTRAIKDARDAFNKMDFEAASNATTAIRGAAGPLLKDEWERVKNGEPGYQDTRKSALRTIKGGIIFVTLLATLAMIAQFISVVS